MLTEALVGFVSHFSLYVIVMLESSNTAIVSLRIARIFSTQKSALP